MQFRQTAGLTAILLVCTAIPGTAPAVADTAEPMKKRVKKALKQVDVATRGVGGVVAGVDYAETVGSRPIEGTGRVWIDLDGRMRAEVAGDNPRTFLLSTRFLHIHRPDDGVVDVYDLAIHPDMLASYAMLGFYPAGTALRKSYHVPSVEETRLDDRDVLRFELQPKAVDGERGVAGIDLWVDAVTGLPLQQRIRHGGGESSILLRYVDMARNDDLSIELFVPRWPEGTTAVRH